MDNNCRRLLAGGRAVATAFLQREIDDGLRGIPGSGLVGRQQQSGTGGGRIGDGADQLGVVRQTLSPIGFRPTPVKYKLAIGVRFQVQGRRAEQSPFIVPADDMPGLPAGGFADAIVAFQGAQEGVAEKRTLVRDEGVPLGSGDVAQAFKAFEAHDPGIDGGNGLFGTRNGASVRRRVIFINTFT